MISLVGGAIAIGFTILLAIMGVVLQRRMDSRSMNFDKKMNTTLGIVVTLMLGLTVLAAHAIVNPLFVFLPIVLMATEGVADTTRFKLLRWRKQEEEPLESSATIVSDVPEGSVWPDLGEEQREEPPVTTGERHVAAPTWTGAMGTLTAIFPETDQPKPPTKEEIAATAKVTAKDDADRLYPPTGILGDNNFMRELAQERERFILDRTAVLVREHSISESTPLEEWWFEWHQGYVERQKQEHEARENQKRIDDAYQERIRAESHRQNIDNRVGHEAETFYPHLTIERRMMGWREPDFLEEMLKFKQDRTAFLLSGGAKTNIPAKEWFNTWRDEYYQERQRVAEEELRDKELHDAYTKLKELGVELKPLDEQRSKVTAPQPKPLETYRR